MTDNYYTTVKLAKHMFERYGWTIVGTIVPTDKVTRCDEDFPFVKLSHGAKNEVKRGWYHEAVMECMAQGNKKYFLQATTWGDKKQVCFLSSIKLVQAMEPRHTGGKGGKYKCCNRSATSTAELGKVFQCC